MVNVLLSSEVLIHETISLCRVCKNAIPAKIVSKENNEVWMKKSCEDHGVQDICIGTNAEWYQKTRSIPSIKEKPPRFSKEVQYGCPFDCGACTSHEQKVRLPVVNITSACNLDCPICFVHNKNEGAYHMTLEDFSETLRRFKEDYGRIDIINLTGGDPTLHPEFLRFLEISHQMGANRITVCTNGIELLKNNEMLQGLKHFGARVALSFDSFEEGPDFMMQGANLVETKLQVIELLEAQQINTSLIPVMVKGMNHHEIGKMIQFAVEKDHVRHLEIHLITYTGQGGVNFPRTGRISLYEVLESIEETTNRLLTPDDFVPSPCTHPLCYQIAFLLKDPDGGAPVPFTRFITRETLYDLLSDRLYIEPSAKLETALQDAINRLWIEDDSESQRILSILETLLRRLYPVDETVGYQEIQQRAEEAVLAVYVHSHMDEETFDTERVAQCCDSVLYPDGSQIPICSNNVLYREKEKDFTPRPKSWNERSGGRKVFLPVLPN